MHHTQRSIVTLISINIARNTVEVIAKQQCRLPQPTGIFISNITLCDGSHNMMSVFRNSTYCVWKPKDVTSNSQLTMARSSYMGAGWKLMNLPFLPVLWSVYKTPSRRESYRQIKELELGTARCEVVNKVGIVLLFLCIGELQACTWFGTVKVLAGDLLLGTLLLDRCIRRTIATSGKLCFGIWGR